MTVRVGVAGVNGRLGSLAAAAVQRSDRAALVGGLVRPGAPREAPHLPDVPVFDDPGALAAVSDVLLDVSHAAAVPSHADAVRRVGIAWVLGATGLDQAAEAAIEEASRSVPVFVASNFSPGAALLIALARLLGRCCPAADYDAEILEWHHRGKRDAPSGTALAIGRAVAEGRGVALDRVAVRGRDGDTGPRPDGAIGFASLRGGGVVGEHSLVLTSGGEQLTLEHRAFDRQVFADGALRAALFVAGRPAGRYAMADLLDPGLLSGPSP